MKSLTIGACRRGEGSPAQRKQFERGAAQVAKQAKETFTEASTQFAAQVARMTEAFTLLAAQVARIDADPLGAVVDQERSIPEIERAIDAHERERKSRAQSEIAKRRRLDITPEDARAFRDEWIQQHGERGAIKAGAAHFGIDARTFSRLLRT